MAPSKVETVEFDKYYNIIDGQCRSAKEYTHGINPATKENLWPVPVATTQDVDDAVKAANKAYNSWKKTTWETRLEHLQRYKELSLSYWPEIKDLLMKETGKPPLLLDIETGGFAGLFDDHAQVKLPELLKETDEKIVKGHWVPVGVVAAICPWNFPIVLAIGKVIPAVLAGNAIIVKPSPFTPYTMLKLVEIAQQVFPPGLVQILGGDDSIGPALVSHPDIHKISFTGSTATGKRIMAAAAGTLKRVTLELGGNDATIVLPDVDIAKVAPQVTIGSFLNSGQICVATKRIFVHKSIYDEFLATMVGFTKQVMKVGAPDEEGVFVGPVQNKMQYDRVVGFFDDCKKNGYKIAVGADSVPESKGYFVPPTIIDNPPSDSRIIQEEPFGPIVPIQPYEDLDEVIARANDSNSGLGACVWSADVAKAEEVANQLEAGSVWVNSHEKPGSDAPFGGHKESGIGHEWGPWGITAYCNAKAVIIYK